MTVEKHLEYIKEQTMKQNAYGYVSGLIGWDSAATQSPKKGYDKKYQYAGILAGESYKIVTDPELRTAVFEAAAQMDTISDIRDRAMVREWKKTIERMEKIPKEEYIAFVELLGKSEMDWEAAKENNDFEGFKDTYGKIFETLRKFADYYGYKEHPYDALIEDFEPGMTVAKLDVFFSELRAEVVPLLQKIMEAKKNKPEDFEFITRFVAKDKQDQISRMILNHIGYDLERGILAESEHPFTNGLTQHDVRITTHYMENNFMSAIFSTAHEGGHGIYEQQQDETLEDRGLRNGASSAVHESQSRMYENVFGRSIEFWKPLYGKLQETYSPALDGVAIENFHRAINTVEPSLIRIEADELTYPLHIMVRYELEKDLLTGKIKVDELSIKWNEKMEEYLGVIPPNVASGVLQDVHWAAGLVGYFPSYALGNAYAAQLLVYMKKDFPVFEDLERGDFTRIHKWLGEKVHYHGLVYGPEELIQKATGEAFNPKYYVEYLKDKFAQIYQL